MKKKLIALVSAIVLLSGCTAKTNEPLPEEPEFTPETTTAATTTATTTTAAVTQTEASTVEEVTEMKEPIEVKIEAMTVKLDASIWEPVDDYIRRKEQEGDPVGEEDLKEIQSYEIEDIFVKEDLDTVLFIYALPLESIKGFGTREDYELLAKAYDYVEDSTEEISTLRSEIVEKNGIMFLDSTIPVDFLKYGQTCSVLKDGMQYVFIVFHLSSPSEREYLYDIIGSATFE